MLDDYTANCKIAARFPAAWVEAFCDITGDDHLARLVMTKLLRMHVANSERELSVAQNERERQQLRELLLIAAGKEQSR